MEKPERLEWLNHWVRECSGIDKNERKGKAYCSECPYKPSCNTAYKEVRGDIEGVPT